MKKNLALILILAAAPAAAQSAPDFDALTRAGFSAVTASAGAAPSAVPAAAHKAVPAGGVYLHSWAQGRLFHCSASGCFQLRASGAANVVSSGQGGVYFTGSDGTGYCDAGACRLLLPGQRVTFPLAAGPRGDIWAANKAGGWHCTPSACVSAFSGGMQSSVNYLDGVYKADGAFAASTDQGTFWCAAGGRCRKVLSGQMSFVEDRCAGTAPVDASYGFWGPQIYRCSASGCRQLAVNDDAVDNYNDCAFDAGGRLLLPRRADRRLTGDSIACGGAACAPDAAPAPKRVDGAPSSDSRWTEGADSARYALNDPWNLPAPADAARPTTRGPVVFREDARRRATLSLDADVSCFQWLPASSDDDDQDGPAWSSTCRLLK